MRSGDGSPAERVAACPVTALPIAVPALAGSASRSKYLFFGSAPISCMLLRLDIVSDLASSRACVIFAESTLADEPPAASPWRFSCSTCSPSRVYVRPWSSGSVSFWPAFALSAAVLSPLWSSAAALSSAPARGDRFSAPCPISSLHSSSK